jgi:DNA-directed RNA polymerase I, II, and III subunit RPABC3
MKENYDYVMYGKIFKRLESENDIINIFASFGGLIMRLHGKSENLKDLTNNLRIYLLMKRA